MLLQLYREFGTIVPSVGMYISGLYSWKNRFPPLLLDRRFIRITNKYVL